MKTILTILLICFEFTTLVAASVPDAVLDFKAKHKIEAGDKILKIETDVNGDGKNEILLCLKSEFEKDTGDHEPAAWSFYIAKNTSIIKFSESTGTETKPNSLAVGDIPLVDHEKCFIGQITEIGKHGIVTIRYNNPREGPSIGIIYAYTIEGDHLVRTELARFSDSSTPHALLTKYLADDKRTVITPSEVTP